MILNKLPGVFSFTISIIVGIMAVDLKRFFIRLVDLDIVKTVRKIVRVFSPLPSVSVRHVGIVGCKRASVHRNLFVIGPQTVALGIRYDNKRACNILWRIANPSTIWAGQKLPAKHENNYGVLIQF
jgi:hypothetical protein